MVGLLCLFGVTPPFGLPPKLLDPERVDRCMTKDQRHSDRSLLFGISHILYSKGSTGHRFQKGIMIKQV